MAEKRGETEKLNYPFNTAGHLEIFVTALNRWHKVTARDFRSFDGKRRISEPEYTELGTVEVPMVTYDYEGPVYVWATNNIVMDTTGEGKLITSHYWEETHKISGSRK